MKYSEQAREWRSSPTRSSECALVATSSRLSWSATQTLRRIFFFFLCSLWPSPTCLLPSPTCLLPSPSLWPSLRLCVIAIRAPLVACRFPQRSVRELTSVARVSSCRSREFPLVGPASLLLSVPRVSSCRSRELPLVAVPRVSSCQSSEYPDGLYR